MYRGRNLICRMLLPAALLVGWGLVSPLTGGAARAQGDGTVLFVDADASPGGDGASWATAFRDLQDALAAAEAGDEVWVAEGVYKPTEGSDRTATFTLASGVALYGGFDGTEQSLEERDWTVNETVLSGNIGDPDDEDDNVYHVVAAQGTGATTILDGFTVADGEADAGAPPHDRGGGFLVLSGSPTVRNVLFRDNDAYRAGGGLYAKDASPLVEDTAFEGGRANVGGGAHFEGSVPVLRRVAFRRNSHALSFYGGSTGLVEDAVLEETVSGGVLYVSGSSPRLVRTSFRNNRRTGTVGSGGAGYIAEGAAPVFEDCLFEGNTAPETGGALLIDTGARPLFLRTTFRDNATFGGGGAVAADLTRPVFLFCRFERNRATFSGGALHALNAAAVVIGSVFAGNVSARHDQAGGAVRLVGPPWQGAPVLIASTAFVGNEGGSGGAVAAYFVGAGEGRMVNVTFAGNRAKAGGGGAVWARDSGGLRIENAVLWGDEAASVPGGEEVYVSEGAGPVVVRSLVAGGCPSDVTCEGVTDADPLFARSPSPGADGWWGTDDDDYGDLRLQVGSPGEDYGLTALLPPDEWDLDGDGDTAEPLPLDVAGLPRVVGASVDAGAHEGVVYVAAEPGPAAGAPLGLAVWPNPVRGAGTVVLDLPEAGEVKVSVYDVLGRRVAALASGRLPAGRHELNFNAEHLPAGVYVVRVEAGDAVRAERVTLVRTSASSVEP